MKNVKLINRQQVADVLTIDKSIELVERVYAAHAAGEVLMPAKITLDTGEGNDWPPYGGSYNAMPAYIGGNLDVSGIKWVWGFEGNRAKGIPYIGGMILLNEAHTGEVLCVMDGSYITDIRTGASAGVAAKYLAKKDAHILTVIGAGVQGRMTARAICRVCPIEEIRVADIRSEALTEYVSEMSAELGVRIVPCQDNHTACKGSDIIVTVTIADEPLVDLTDCAKGATVLSLGSFQELDERIPLQCDKLIVDSWAQNAHRGELCKLVRSQQLTEADVFCEIQEIVAGHKPGRENNEELICACIIGMGSTDIGTAGALYQEFFRDDATIRTFSFR